VAEKGNKIGVLQQIIMAPVDLFDINLVIIVTAEIGIAFRAFSLSCFVSCFETVITKHMKALC